MRPVVLMVPGRLDVRTGGSIYNRRIADGLARLGWPVEVRELDESFPRPTAGALAHAAGVFAGLDPGALAIVDGLAFSAMPDVVAREARRLPIVALVHLPLAAEVGLAPEAAARLEADEGRALAAAALVIGTGPATRPLLERYALAADRIVVVEPGTDRAPLARGSGGGPIGLVSVGTLNPGKGHETLVRALAGVSTRDWHLTCAGSVTRHPGTAARVREVTRSLGLEGRVSLVGDLDAPALAECFDRADLFVLATCRETYGMAVAEALARGLPVVSTTTGAIPELVGRDAGVLVPPGDVPALSAALSRVIEDAALRQRLAEGARRVRDHLRTWEQASDHMAAVLQSLDAHG